MYKVNFTETAVESLKKIDKIISKRIIEKIEWLSLNFDLIKPISLKDDFSDLYKLRVGNYRVIYELDYFIEGNILILFTYIKNYDIKRNAGTNNP